MSGLKVWYTVHTWWMYAPYCTTLHCTSLSTCMDIEEAISQLKVGLRNVNPSCVLPCVLPLGC